MPARSNLELAALPDDLAVMRAVAVCDERHNGRYRGLGVYAQAVAWKLDIAPARRLGRGAVQGSWSGSMAPALRIAPRLQSLVRRGLLGKFYGERSVTLYYLTAAGREFIEREGGAVPDEVYEMENVDPLGDRETNYKVGERVTIDEDHEIYPGETGIVKGVGVGVGSYAGSIVYDVMIDDTDEPYRFAESEVV